MSTLRDLQAKVFDRINPAVRFSVTRYVLSIGFFVAVVAFGLISTRNLGVDLLPAVNIPVVVVNTSFPGASPPVVEEQVSQVLENAVSTLSGITTMKSTSVLGFSRVVISFDPDTDRFADTNQVAALVSAAARSLPNGVSAPSVQTYDPNALPILQLGILATGASLEDVGSYAENDLTPILQRVDGVANIQLDGAPQRQFQVLLNPNKLGYYRVNPQQVTGAVAGSALNQSIGTVSSNGQTITFSTQSSPEDIAQISSILVDATRGIRVSDLGAVRDVPQPTTFARVNGRPVALVSIQKTTESNAVAVVQNVRDLLAVTPLPSGYSIVVSNDTTEPIKASIRSTYRELIITGIVVAMVCLLFLGRLNTALSVILAIPIALSAAPVLYKLAGFNFNQVSLLALIVAVGIVVDDSIVVAENVERYRLMGYSLKDSVLKGASEVFSAVVAASLSLISVLLPVSFIGGFVGHYLMQFSLGLAAAVLFSLFEAVLFLTVRLAYTPDARPRGWKDLGEAVRSPGREMQWGLRTAIKPLGIALWVVAAAVPIILRRYWLLPAALFFPVILSLAVYLGKSVLALVQALTMAAHQVAERGLGWLRDRYANALGPVLRRGVWVLVGAGAFFLGTVFLLGPRIPFSFVPQTDSGVMQVNLRLAPGTPIDVTNDATGRVEAWLFDQPEVLSVQTTVGSNGVSTFGSNSNISGMTVQLAPLGTRRSIFLLARDYRRSLLALLTDLPSPGISASAAGGLQGQGSRVSFTLSSSDFNELSDANQKVLSLLMANRYVEDASSDLSATTLENDFLPDPHKLNGTGITPATIADALQTYTSGVQASTVQLGGISYPIIVEMDPTQLSGAQSLLNLPLYSSALQSTLRAGQFGTFVLTRAPLRLDRTNRRYSTDLDIDLAPNAPTPLSFQKEVTADMTKEGILGRGISFGAEKRFGPADLAAQLAGQAPFAFLLAFFLVYLVMGAQFNSWRYPVYLLLPVPLALAGALWLVWTLGSGLDIFGLLGMLMLIGLSAKNAILYLDFVVERMKMMPFTDALIESARLRFRPIIMTTVTVLVISFPLIFGRGQGAEFGQKLGIVMLGGVISSTVLTFYVVPAAFFLFERKRHPEAGPAAPL
jgi:hydrophobic/amphiphilic exporter-1 (mainly G- bacteria), HAE1 family